MIEEVWDAICDGFEYIISFEWLIDFWEAVTGVFENIGEFSMIGLVFGIIGVGFIYAVREHMLYPFLQYMTPASAIFWGGATYVATFVGAYLVGNHFENS